MGLGDLFRRIADESRPDSTFARAVQVAMSPAGILYGIGAQSARHLYDLGIRKREEVAAPVLSVGNVTMGGTGKTPFCVWLARHLQASDLRPAIVSRGYGREDEGRLVVAHDGRRVRATPAQAGDEPLLLASLLGDVPVVCCSNRAEGARHALKRLRAHTIILDDGFQHHALARQGDIVLVDATRPLRRLSVFPRGSLREPLSGLSRAHMIVLTRWNQAKERDRAQLYRWLRSEHPGVAVVRMNVVPDAWVRLVTGEARPIEELRGAKCALVCGVGNPGSVAATAREVGLASVSNRILRDHAAITTKMLARVEQSRRTSGADWILLTEKDAARVPNRASFPKSAIAIRVRLAFVTKEDEDRAVRTIAARLAARPVRGLLR